MEELNNASQFPKFYYARHMVNGLCGYDDETILVDVDTMKRMASSMNGKPVYNYKHDERTNSERLKDIKEKPCGYVTDTFYNELDGWLWSKMMIIDDDAHENIGSGKYSVSNAYIPTEYSNDGGTHLNVPFDRRIRNGEFTHIALVTNPRYEEAKIYTPEQFKIYQDSKRQQLNELKNSKEPERKHTMLTFFKTKKEEVTDVSEATSVQLTNSKGEKVEVSVEEMVNAVLQEETQKTQDEKQNAKVKVGDKEMTLSELVDRYQKLNAKDEKKNETDEDEKNNSSQAEENKNDKDGEKNNSNEGEDHFNELMNADKNKFKPMSIETNLTKLQRGQSLYGGN